MFALNLTRAVFLWKPLVHYRPAFWFTANFDFFTLFWDEYNLVSEIQVKLIYIPINMDGQEIIKYDIQNGKFIFLEG